MQTRNNVASMGIGFMGMRSNENCAAKCRKIRRHFAVYFLPLRGEPAYKASPSPMLPPASGPHKAKLLDRVRQSIRFKHYSLRTEQVYVDWIKRFILFHGKRHPEEMGAAEVREFLTHLAVKGRVAASTQNQAFSALLFLYREVLKQELPWIDDVE